MYIYRIYIKRFLINYASKCIELKSFCQLLNKAAERTISLLFLVNNNI